MDIFSNKISRRAFLSSAIGAFGASLLPSSVMAQEWVDKWWSAEIDKEFMNPEITPPDRSLAATKVCAGRLRLKSSIHGGSHDFQYRDTAGNYNHDILSSMNWFFRCRDGSWQYIDVAIIELLNYLSALLEVPEILVSSGYRSPDYNKQLAAKNESVARNSLHQHGRALDISISGISINDVCSYALYARNIMGYGGVGYYPRAGFVHLDSGVKKQWAGA